MSRPTAISPEEQEQAARRIGVLLLQAAPEDWQEITVEYRATGEYHDLLGEVTTPDGTARSWEPPEELRGIFEQLRDGMYRPDVGTWLSALYVVERPSSYRIDINFDSEPRWQRPLPRAAYADELRRYPRAEENVPDWLREKIDGREPSEARDTADTPTAAQEAVAPAEPGTGGAPRFRTAETFDDFDEQGRPLVATRNPVQPDEVAALRQYLENAPIVLASRENEEDLLAPDRAATVPGTWHTDGSWLWQGAVAYYLAQYGVPPEADLVEHIRARRFTLAEVDDATRDAAVSELLDQPADDEFGESGEPGDAGSDFAAERAEHADSYADSTEYSESPAVAQVADTPAAADSGDHVDDDQPGHRREYEDEPYEDRSFTDELDDRPFGAESFDDDSARAERSDTADSWSPEPETPSAADDDHSRLDAQEVFAKLHDKLTEYAVDGSDYRIGSHSSGARSLVQEGPDWIVTAGADDEFGSDVRFSRPDQAAAYLLGSLLLSRPAGQVPQDAEPARPVAEPEPETEADEDAVASADAEADAREPHDAATSGEAPAAQQSQFDGETRVAQQPQFSSEATVAQPTVAPEHPVAPEVPAAAEQSQRPDPEPRRQEQSAGGHFLFTANQDPQPGQSPQQDAAPGAPVEEPTRFQPAPRMDRPAPPAGPPASPAGPPASPPPAHPASPPGGMPAQAAAPGGPNGPGQARRRSRSARRARSRARRCRRLRRPAQQARPVARSAAPAPVGRAWRGRPGRGRRSRPARPEAVRRRAAGRSRGVRRRARASRSSRSAVSRR
ncbi:hypothetical protein [Saccharopolyspora erythraea]|uniref:hypothetical protein n=1 Tax=Saccharopolyspora erythraea TaxID=1836 RepID=UPI0020128AAB|nr:hypothetical protein [Saccharopolyspora erythraea]